MADHHRGECLGCRVRALHLMRLRHSYGPPVAASGSPLFPFTGGTLPVGATLTRASTGWYFDSAGVLQSAANDVARFTYDPATLALQGLLVEPARTNSIRNNTMVGANAPSTLPTNWIITQNAGLTTDVVGTGSASGLDYIDIRFSGTPSATLYRVALEASNGIAALSGQTWTESAYIAIANGGLTNITKVNFTMVERTAGGASVAFQGAADYKASLSSSFYRASFVQTLAGGGTVAFVSPEFSFGLTVGLAVDVTFRIALPPMEQGSGASSPIKTSSAAVARAADVLTLALADGTYNIDITRASGVTNVVGAVVSGGAYTVPTDLSPLQSVAAKRTA